MIIPLQRVGCDAWSACSPSVIDSGLTSTALTCICPVGAYRSLTWITLHPILQLDKGIDDVFPIRLFTGPSARRHLMSILGARANVMFIMKQMEATQSHLMSLKVVLCPLKLKKMSISELSGNPLGQEASRPLFIPEQGRYLVHNFTRNEPWSCGTSPAM